MKSHAAHPQALHLGGGVYRIFFSTRDVEGRSSVAYLDLNIERPKQMLSLSEKPVLSPGQVGLFDDSGVVPSCVVRLPSGLALYYWGCSLSVTTPFNAFLGLAFLNEERDSASRLASVPLLDRNPDDPYSNGAGFVCASESGTGFQLWFERQEWSMNAGSIENHSVGIKHASSPDGINWHRSPGFSLPPLGPGSIFATPCVLPSENGYRMWYSHKVKGSYRIGGAESGDGLSWSRKDETLGMLASGSGWDSEEVAYPNVFEHDGTLFMLYNGDGYGRTGFGLAVWMSH
jgi:hypothetical protein